MKRLGLVIVVFIFAAWGIAFADSSTDRISEARKVFEDIMGAPGGGIPHELLETTRCIVIVPTIHGAGLVFGGRYGLGVATCRNEIGWTAPSTIRIEGGRFSKQIIRGQESLVLLVMSEDAAYRLIKSPLILGAEGSVVGGPVGAYSSECFVVLRCANPDVIAYARLDGYYVDMPLEGAMLRPADDINQTMYGTKVRQEDILIGLIAVPRTADSLMSVITRYSEPTAEAF